MNPYIILVIIIFVLIYNNNKIHEDYNDDNICRGKLSDHEYIQNMIPHHQVAIDISIKMQKKTKSPVMHEILRKLIWMQKYEIKLMNLALKKLPADMTSSKIIFRKYVPTISDNIKPNNLGLTNTYCDPNFFDPNSHMTVIRDMKLTEEMYIKHMIPHHQVAVDMSKVLLKNTTNDFMIYLAYRIIRSQQGEVIMLDNLLKKSTFKYSSNLIN